MNFCECKMHVGTTVVYETEFLGREWLKSLRDAYKEYAFYRQGSHVFFWDNGSGKTVYFTGFQYKTIQISLTNQPRIFSKMLEYKIISLFRKITNYKVYLNKYSNTWEIVSDKDLLDDAGLKVFRCVNINTYFLRFGDEIVFGFTLSTRIRNRFEWKRKDFLQNGIDCTDLYGKEDTIFANKPAVKRYLEARGLEEKYNSMLHVENGLDKEFHVISSTMKWIADKLKNVQLYNSVTIESCEIKYLPYSENIMEHSIIPKPKRYYSNDKEGLGGRYDEQLRSLRPYSVSSFSGKKLSILVLSPISYEGTVSDFVKKLKDNLAVVFQLNQINIEMLLTNGIALKDYEKAMYDRKFNNIDLGIIVVSETQRTLSIDKSPYYFCKAKYIGQGIPTQEIQIEKIKSIGIKYIVNNIALNIYAKLGGTPWGIEKTEHLKKEFIIGIGSTVNDQKKMVMGIANIFDYTGKYFVGDCVPMSGFDEYVNKLEEVIYDQLNGLILNYNDEIRLIFHIFKSPSSRYEIKALSNVINKLKVENIRYAFVHVGYGHNFRLFKNDGKESVAKGFYINISANEALINFVDKSSIPLKITVDRRSNFHDIYYLAKQIYWFSHLSCRSYMPAKKSVSIVYPSLMARMTERLKKIDGWDYDILKTVGDKLWFI